MAAHDDVDDGHHRDGHLAPAQQLARLQATPAGNQFVLGGGGDGDAMQQTEFLNAQSQRGDVAGITAVVLADFDVGDPAGWTGIYSGGVRLSIAASRWAWPPLSVFVRGLGMRLPVRRQSATLACCQPLLDLASAPAWGRGADPDRLREGGFVRPPPPVERPAIDAQQRGELLLPQHRKRIGGGGGGGGRAARRGDAAAGDFRAGGRQRRLLRFCAPGATKQKRAAPSARLRSRATPRVVNYLEPVRPSEHCQSATTPALGFHPCLRASHLRGPDSCGTRRFSGAFRLRYRKEMDFVVYSCGKIARVPLRSSEVRSRHAPQKPSCICSA